jgi:hypothetical protein
MGRSSHCDLLMPVKNGFRRVRAPKIESALVCQSSFSHFIPLTDTLLQQ